MKKYFLFLAALLICTPSFSGNFWKGLGNIVKGVATVAASAAIEQVAEKSGMSPEEAQKGTRNLMEMVGADKENIEQGLRWNDARDKFEREKVATDVVFDAVGDISGNPELVKGLKGLTDANLTYYHESNTATSPEEKRAAFDKRTNAYAYLLYDTYQGAKDRHAKNLAEKLEIKKQLERKGYDSSIADDIASSILAVRKSKDWSEDEKEQYYSQLGLSQSTSEIEEAIISTINDDDYLEKEQERERKIREEQEKKRREEELAREKARIEKENSIKSIVETQINFYAFDVTSLNDAQKVALNHIFDVLDKYPSLNLAITGHTCVKGYKSVNQRIGLKRAEAAKAYLVDKGISADRLTTYSKGELDPVCPNASLEDRKINRRLSFEVSE